MKVFLGLSLLAALAAAEPVGFRQQDRQQRQYYLAQVKEEAAEAPYPPSGFRPAGPAFNYPEKQKGASGGQYHQAPERQYGAPSVPQQQYGAPREATTTDLPTTTDLEDETTAPTEFEAEPVTSLNELDDEDSKGAAQRQQTGEYYVALPDGRLQRVSYVSRQDVEAMKYFAKIRAENVDPLRGPIFAYEPLQKLQVLPAGLPPLTVAPVAPVAPVASANLEIEPVTQIQYRYDNPSEVMSVGNAPLSFAGKYQLPAASASAAAAAAAESRYLLTFQ